MNLKDTKWEWLHLYAFSYGKARYDNGSPETPQDARNLVVGTSENTSMLLVESFLKSMTLAGAKVSVEADFRGIQISNPGSMINELDELSYCRCATSRDSVVPMRYDFDTSTF